MLNILNSSTCIKCIFIFFILLEIMVCFTFIVIIYNLFIFLLGDTLSNIIDNVIYICIDSLSNSIYLIHLIGNILQNIFINLNKYFDFTFYNKNKITINNILLYYNK
jgi:hypothetical protein